MAQPLAGLRVLELAEGIAGPYAGKLLADYGADVIKVEPPAGDRSRRSGPFPDDVPDLEQSALYLHLNTNKRSVVADLDQPAGRSLVSRLATRADLLIESFEPGRMASLGLGYEQLRAARPGLVMLSVTSFGQTGPYAGYQGEELIHYAVGGPLSASGNPEREPVKMGGDLGQYQCGGVAAVASLAALAVASRSGRGVWIDLANVETQVASIDRRMTYLLYGAYRGEDVPRFGGYSVGILPGGVRPTADGYIQVSTLPNWMARFLKVLNDPDLSARYANPGWMLDPDVPELADASLLSWSLQRGMQEAMEEAQAAGWPITAVNRPAQLLTDPHFSERGFFVPVAHPVAGTTLQPGAPIRMEDGWQLRRPAPRLGEHTDEVTNELASRSSADGPMGTTTQIAGTTGADTSTVDVNEPRLPLEGLRVLDLTVVWAGPYVTMFLADLGAEVIRIDNPWIFPAATRGVLPRPPRVLTDRVGGIFGGYPDGEPGERPWNRVALFTAHARGKRSITLDMRKPLGREMFLRLVDTADVLVENNSVDLLTKLDIDWPVLHERNPRLVVVRMPSVGLAGPYRNYLGFGVNFEGLCGLTALRGYPDLDLTENETVFHMDAASGSAGAFAVLAALRRREATGQGELVELSQSENMLNHIGEYLIDAAWNGDRAERLGNRHRTRAPQGVYPSGGGIDQWVTISVGSDEQWQALCQLIGTPELARLDQDERRARHDDLDARIVEWTKDRSASETFIACQEAGIPAGPVLHEVESLNDPHFRARGMFRPNGSQELGTHDYPAHPWHWDGPPLRWGPIPVLGGDNEAVYRELLGVNDDEWQALQDDGHISRDYLAPDGSPL